jgi:hypothetical protein
VTAECEKRKIAGFAKHNFLAEGMGKGEGFQINVTLLEVSLTSPARPSDKNTEKLRKVLA